MADEIEFKYGLTGEVDLGRVREAAGGEVSETVKQTNTFFDTADKHLDAGRCVVRVRTSESPSGTAFHLTLKGVETTEGELTRKAESEWVIYEAVATELLAGKRDPLAHAKELAEPDDEKLLNILGGLAQGQPLRPIGAFTNERTKVQCDLSGLPATLELDVTEFPGEVVECELECEVPAAQVAEYRKALNALMDKAGVKTHKSKSKAARFFRALREAE